MSLSYVLHLGDCLEVMRTLESESFDACVTDPPAGISFMGKEWDHHKGGRPDWVAWMTSVMAECLRVLKPGAHGLVWALPRTSHWTATALEDAGFEVRDVVTHIQGQGFPKSLDVSKAIDKAAGLERERIPGGQGGKNNVLGARKPGEAISGEAISGEAISGEAKKWSGFGTALKPASEHWILVRKPCSEKTVAANVLKWGTGALNIDGSRIACEGGSPSQRVRQSNYTQKTWDRSAPEVYAAPRAGESIGRFPANLVFSHTPHCTDEQCDIECAVKALDAQSGTLSRQGSAKKKNTLDSSLFGGGAQSTYFGDSGAARFFYCAKISASERNAGGPNTHPTVKPQKLMRYLCKLICPPGGHVLDPFAGSGSTGVAALREGFRFTGIEREAEYAEIAEKRMEAAL